MKSSGRIFIHKNLTIKSNKFYTFAQVKYNEFIRILKRDVRQPVRQAGSHIIMEHPDKKNHTILPDHGNKEIGKGLQLKIMKQAGLK